MLVSRKLMAARYQGGARPLTWRVTYADPPSLPIDVTSAPESSRPRSVPADALRLVPRSRRPSAASPTPEPIELIEVATSASPSATRLTRGTVAHPDGRHIEGLADTGDVDAVQLIGEPGELLVQLGQLAVTTGEHLARRLGQAADPGPVLRARQQVGGRHSAVTGRCDRPPGVVKQGGNALNEVGQLLAMLPDPFGGVGEPVGVHPEQRLRCGLVALGSGGVGWGWGWGVGIGGWGWGVGSSHGGTVLQLAKTPW